AGTAVKHYRRGNPVEETNSPCRRLGKISPVRNSIFQGLFFFAAFLAENRPPGNAEKVSFCRSKFKPGTKVALIKSVSGIRGTIGGSVSENLTPPDIVKFTAAYGTWLKGRHESVRVVVGRDARPSGEMLNRLVCATLQALAIDVIDLGLSTTPTVEIAVPRENAQGGIILTASHNPVQWNALKLLNEAGEFISAEDGQAVLQLAAQEQFDFAPVTRLGKIEYRDDYFRKHIEAILDLPLVDAHAVRNRNFRIVVDAVNSSGGIAVPMLLEELGVSVTKLHCEPTGHFPHNPEPLPEH